MIRFVFLAILNALFSSVCPSCCISSIDGRRSWRFTGTQLWYTCDSLCRRRTTIPRRKTQWLINNVRYAQPREKHQISELTTKRYHCLRFVSDESAQEEYRDLTLSTLYSDEVRTPLLPSFNRCGAEGQPQRRTWWSCLAGSVLRMQIKRNAHQDRYTTYTIAIANPVMTRAAMRTPYTDTGIVDRARRAEMDINI